MRALHWHDVREFNPDRKEPAPGQAEVAGLPAGSGPRQPYLFFHR
jgi:hypothetical protein